MLAKRYRFHSRGGVKYTYKMGKTIRTPKISLVYAKNERNRQRFGVVISKKVLKSAVSRNHVRRRIYEAIRLELPQYKVKNDCLFVIFSKEVIDMSFAELRALIHSLMEQSMI